MTTLQAMWDRDSRNASAQDEIRGLMRANRVLRNERNRLRTALSQISEVNNGPDRASGEVRAMEAAAIATNVLSR